MLCTGRFVHQRRRSSGDAAQLQAELEREQHDGFSLDVCGM